MDKIRMDRIAFGLPVGVSVMLMGSGLYGVLYPLSTIRHFGLPWAREEHSRLYPAVGVRNFSAGVATLLLSLTDRREAAGILLFAWTAVGIVDTGIVAQHGEKVSVHAINTVMVMLVGAFSYQQGHGEKLVDQTLLSAIALKSFTSNISSNYSIAPQPTSSSGPWKVFDAKHRKTGKLYSVFIFDKKTLEPQGGTLSSRSSSSSALRKLHEEVLERLKKEASSLARLRHPSILELAEPVEETRNGGLMFATESITVSLAGLLQDKDEQERTGGGTGRASRFVVEDVDGTKRRRELEIDELEIQKGLLQLAKGLEFLHESAGLVHANLTPEAIMVNGKGDWKISALSYCSPHEGATGASSITPISLSEVLDQDPRLPRSVQLNLDYTSPDFVLDNRLAASADMFSLGLLVLALYNSPHASPLHTSGSLSAYKRLFSSSSSVPTQNNNFLVPASRPLPPKLASELLPRLITRRAASRMTAREFQQAGYFDNILVSTIRFLDALPAKTPSEKTQFMRGLPRIMPQFPKSVLEKKVLPALLEEMKDKELLAPILTNIFAMVKSMPSGKRVFTERVVPRLRETFLTKSTSSNSDRDTVKEAGLMIVLENTEIIAQNCSGKEFRDDILPIILLALESPTHGIVDTTLGTLAYVLPVLDFSTIKNELFPAIATVFAKTSSLAIKVRGLEAFYTLIGGTASSEDESRQEDDLNGFSVPDKRDSLSSKSSSTILDKYTVQEKVMPLLKGIKTKEPGVMMAALKVFRQVGKVADTDFLAMDVLPVLWTMSLGPLLNLQQFQSFMTLIKSISGKIEREQVRKLQELSTTGAGGFGASGRSASRNANAGSSGQMNGISNGNDEVDFESLVTGRKNQAGGNDDLLNDWGTPMASASTTSRPPTTRSASSTTFGWQTSAPQPQQQQTLRPQQQQFTSMQRQTITPDQNMSTFASLTPASQFSQPLQPSRSTSTPAQQPLQSSSSSAFSMPMRPAQPQQSGGFGGAATSVNWSAANKPATTTSVSNGWGAAGNGPTSFNLPPPPTSPPSLSVSGWQVPPQQRQQQQQQQQQQQKSGGGLDKYQSLI
ncbi:hypothetical protein K431DRAFT_306688 [Polychaeton citri CBS 116435]|uniref:Protein kinase domain-containing protein n=1 Tax=Polychaeton citri CBS 116435 TaxID=1314669 RepID=A0A9P4Q3I4_9PEZI|nr:hypothetical protein K431DRAFT_306688 [Polychaeton citri CBS 116435]